MKKLLNTVYITTEGASLRKTAKTLLPKLTVLNVPVYRFTC